MTDHRYILEPYKTPASRYDCPGCGKRKTFSRYLDTETGEHLHPGVGRCNREINCGYHYKPKQYFQDNKPLFDGKEWKQPRNIGAGYTKPKQARTPEPKPPVSFIPFEMFEKSRKAYGENNFVIFLYNHFNKFHGEGLKITNTILQKYPIGTVIPEHLRAKEFWKGGVIFYEIDTARQILYGNVMQYNSDTGKRSKYQNTVHSLLKLGSYKRCLFGEHLLNLPGNRNKVVALFEAPKTAVIASVYFEQFICIACGGLQGLSPEKCKALRGRTVILYPDLSAPKPGNPSAFEIWSDKAKELSRLFPGTRFTVSDLLERKASETERQQGLDLADYLIRFDYRAFQQQEQPEHQQQAFEQPQPKEIAQVQELHTVEESYFTEPETPKPACHVFIGESWEQEITELEHYFETATLPAVPVKLNPYSTITNVSLFIHSHFETVKANNGKRTFLPYLNRLQELKQVLTINSN